MSRGVGESGAENKIGSGLEYVDEVFLVSHSREGGHEGEARLTQ